MRTRPNRLAIAAATLIVGCSNPADKPSRVIIISIDTLRADRLGIYGNDRPTSPFLDRFTSEDAVLFRNGYSQSNWTIPSHMSLFTGLYPKSHGVLKQDARLAPEVRTLAEVFKDANHQSSKRVSSAAFTDGGFLGGSHGFADGFDSYDDKHEEPKGVFGLRRTYQLAENWLTEHQDDNFLLFLHSYDVHAAYYFPEPYRSMFNNTVEETALGKQKMAWVRSLQDCSYFEPQYYRTIDHLVATYDGGVRFVDEYMGRLFAHLKKLGIYEDTTIVFTSDHGESFMDTDFYIGHGVLLSEAETHIPLIIKFPQNRFAGTTIDEVVQSIDVMPTLIEALELDSPEELLVQGRSLLPLLDGRLKRAENRFAFSSSTWHFGFDSVRSSDWALITEIPQTVVDTVLVDRMRPDDLLEFHKRVPKELHLTRRGHATTENLATDYPEVLSTLLEAHREWQESQEKGLRFVAGQRDDFLPEEVKNLRALGYLGGN